MPTESPAHRGSGALTSNPRCRRRQLTGSAFSAEPDA